MPTLKSNEIPEYVLHTHAQVVYIHDLNYMTLAP